MKNSNMKIGDLVIDGRMTNKIPDVRTKILRENKQRKLNQLTIIPHTPCVSVTVYFRATTKWWS